MEGARFLLSGVVLGQPMGGVRRHNAELLPRLSRLLRERGATLTLLEGNEALGFELPDEIARVSCAVPAAPPLARAVAEGRAVRSMLREAREAGSPYSLFHSAHLPVPGRLEIPLTLTIHDLRRLDSSHSSGLRRMTARFTLRRALSSAARVFCVTETVRAELASRFPFTRERLRVISNAADHLTPLPRAPHLETGLLHIGHLEPRKNLELLLHALALEPSLPRLTLAGAAKLDEDARLRELAGKLGIADRVQFLGAVSDDQLPKLLASAACVVLPSRIEGFGIGVLEAQLARAPLAISDIPALREVAGDVTPRFSPEDPAACVRAIGLAMTMSDEALTKARARAQRYSWDESARAWFDSWDELIRA